VRHTEIKRQVDADDIAAVDHLLDTVAGVDGRRPLSDHLYLDLVGGGSDGFAALLVSEEEDDDPLVAYAQVSRANDAHVLELVVAARHRSHTGSIGRDLLARAFDVIAADGGGAVNWWVFEPTDAHRQLAADAGMHVGRTLFQMTRMLPTGMDVTVDTRAFRPHADDAAWLSVNNRAFADHGEQGGWTLDTLLQRQEEPWFDPEGFRVHERDGRMAAFCWTKVHPPADPADTGPVGEIYVIAVDPAFHGLGLGKQLTLAGLEHLSSRGITSALLYVDAANTTAVGMYERLGFGVSATNVAFATHIAPATAPISASDPRPT
jgi:mycothiol synthase